MTTDSTKRLLLVEDDDALRSTLSANLDLSGFEVLEARTGEEALEIASRTPVDIMLTDVLMPGINGVDAARGVRLARPGIPVLVMSAVAPEDVIVQALIEGAFTAIRKPFDFTILVEILESALQHKQVLILQSAAARSPIAGPLEAAGVRVTSTADEEEALRIVAQSSVDVCVVDVDTVSGRALEIFERIRAASPTASLLATGSVGSEILGKLARIPRTAILRGPTKVPDVIRSIALFRGGDASW